MVTKIMKWVSITALLLTVFWHPSASLDFVVCAGAILVVLALFFIKQEIETYYGVDQIQAREPSHCKAVSVAVLSTTANREDTTNTGTMLIEQAALLPESLRFESEPWI